MPKESVREVSVKMLNHTKERERARDVSVKMPNHTKREREREMSL